MKLHKPGTFLTYEFSDAVIAIVLAADVWKHDLCFIRFGKMKRFDERTSFINRYYVAIV